MLCGAFILCSSPLAPVAMTPDTTQMLLDLKVVVRLQNIRTRSDWRATPRARAKCFQRGLWACESYSDEPCVSLLQFPFWNYGWDVLHFCWIQTGKQKSIPVGFRLWFIRPLAEPSNTICGKPSFTRRRTRWLAHLQFSISCLESLREKIKCHACFLVEHSSDWEAFCILEAGWQCAHADNEQPVCMSHPHAQWA